MRLRFFIFFILSSSLCRAEFISIYSLSELCNVAEIIVEGEYVRGDLVAVHKIYKTNLPVADTIEVKNIGFYKRPEETHKLFLFMDRGYHCEEGQYRMICPDVYQQKIKTSKLEYFPGNGLIWYSDTSFYSYEQWTFFGGFELTKQAFVPVKRIGEIIDIGLKEAAIWLNASSQRSKYYLANSVAPFLLKKTSPTPSDYSYYARLAAGINWEIIQSEARKILVPMVKSADSTENFEFIVDALYDAGGCTPMERIVFLGSLLDSVNSIKARVQILKRLSYDTLAIPVLRKQLNQKEPLIQIESAYSLSKLNDKASSIIIENILAQYDELIFDIKNFNPFEAYFYLDKIRASPVLRKLIKKNEPSTVDFSSIPDLIWKLRYGPSPAYCPTSKEFIRLSNKRKGYYNILPFDTIKSIVMKKDTFIFNFHSSNLKDGQYEILAKLFKYGLLSPKDFYNSDFVNKVQPILISYFDNLSLPKVYNNNKKMICYSVMSVNLKTNIPTHLNVFLNSSIKLTSDNLDEFLANTFEIYIKSYPNSFEF